MNALSVELMDFLKKKGADLVGFGDLSSIVGKEGTIGISIIKAISMEVVNTIEEGPTRPYFDNYHELNKELEEIALSGEQFLKQRGYEAEAHIDRRIKEFGNYRTALPQKTVATNAGIGWIGKSALLVTKEYGPAVRLSSIITNAPLTVAEPITASLCGNCTKCRDACPAGAITGTLWKRGMDRDELLDPIRCRKKARELAASHIQEEITLCGKCLYICPYTRRRETKEESKNPELVKQG